MTEVTGALTPVNQAARILRVPPTWLREQIERGLLPGLTAGSRQLVHVPTIQAILVERASAGPSGSDVAGARGDS